ncbi:hypothetical protein [Microbacterium murale]|uniref:Outer membrane lipoprotein n=1 Tax=Microbacterium murale TaxID=1081040 RepID=A0ABU0PAV5_9MICO|nr:hypothetical protein [Microbacterium murale]MDQ0644458.1 putative outer membrane lipoprotein [Microbacterium murale]
MSTPILAIFCALGIIVPLVLEFLPSQRKRRAAAADPAPTRLP